LRRGSHGLMRWCTTGIVNSRQAVRSALDEHRPHETDCMYTMVMGKQWTIVYRDSRASGDISECHMICRAICTVACERLQADHHTPPFVHFVSAHLVIPD